MTVSFNLDLEREPLRDDQTPASITDLPHSAPDDLGNPIDETKNPAQSPCLEI